MKRRRELLGAFVALIVTACAGASASPSSEPVITAIQAGALPDTIDPQATPATTTTIAVTTTTGAPLAADGTKVLMIGDSILASTAKRYTNIMCDTLVPRSWKVAVEAEVSQPIGFAREVQQARLDEGWDVGLIFLGTNYEGNADKYLASLDGSVAAFGDVPVILVTVTERDDRMRRVNEQIRAAAALHPNVRIVDWAGITATYPSLLFEDGIHPTDAGRRVLVDAIASVMGDAPAGGGKGECLESQFVDDGNGLPPGVVPVTSTTSPSGRVTTTTVRSSTSTSTGGTSTTTLSSTTPPTSNSTVSTTASTATSVSTASPGPTTTAAPSGG